MPDQNKSNAAVQSEVAITCFMNAFCAKDLSETERLFVWDVLRTCTTKRTRCQMYAFMQLAALKLDRNIVVPNAVADTKQDVHSYAKYY